MSTVDRKKWEDSFKNHILPSLMKQRCLLRNTPAMNIINGDDQCIEQVLAAWEQTPEAVDRRDKIDWRRSYGRWPNQMTIQQRSAPMASVHRLLGVVKINNPFDLHKRSEFEVIKRNRDLGRPYPRLFLFQADPAQIATFSASPSERKSLPPATWWIADTDALIDFVNTLIDAHFLADNEDRGRWAKNALDDLGIKNSSSNRRVKYEAKGYRIDGFPLNEQWKYECKFTWEAYDAWGARSFVDPDGSARFMSSLHEPVDMDYGEDDD